MLIRMAVEDNKGFYLIDYSELPGASIDSYNKNICCSVTQLYLTLCDPMHGSTPGLPVHHQLLKLAQTQVHRVGDAIQPSHPLSSPSAFSLSWHQGLSGESVLHIR